MLFNSLTFFALLLPTLGAYWLFSHQKLRSWLLLLASILFYGFYHWPSVLLLLFTIGFNFFIGRKQAANRSRILLFVSIAMNLTLLFWFKYSAFMADNVNALLDGFHVSIRVPRPPLFLPLGISFFTFQVVAYQIDIYRGEIAAEPSVVRFAVFKCFFPQLIAGPIVRAKDFLPQLRSKIRFDASTFHHGVWLVMAGLALKVGVADVLGQFADEAFRAPLTLSTATAWTSLYAYSFQLYADFWGYSTIAVGLAALFGFSLPLNFDSPYLSSSLQEFWRRWHITLSAWFRDYVYIPLGGNRKRMAANLLITMALAGLWHGAGWTFLLWGLGHGIWLLLERWTPDLLFTKTPIGKALKMFLVFQGVCLLWILFRAPTLEIAAQYYTKLFSFPFTVSSTPSILTGWLIAFAVIQWPLAWTFKEGHFVRLPLKFQWPLALVCCYMILAYAGARVDFIYFTF